MLITVAAKETIERGGGHDGIVVVHADDLHVHLRGEGVEQMRDHAAGHLEDLSDAATLERAMNSAAFMRRACPGHRIYTHLGFNLKISDMQAAAV